MSSKAIITLSDGDVGLGPLRSDLIETYVRWRNDPRVALTLTGQLRPVTHAEMQRWYESSDQGAIRFLIYDQLYATAEPMGVVQLTGIDRHNGTAALGLWIGEVDEWGRGLGTRAVRLMLRYAFRTLGLYSVALAVHNDNEAAIRVYQKAGFQTVGLQRKVVYRDGKRVDSLLMDCLADEWLRANP